MRTVASKTHRAHVSAGAQPEAALAAAEELGEVGTDVRILERTVGVLMVLVVAGFTRVAASLFQISDFLKTLQMKTARVEIEESYLPTLLRMRLLVGFLGERAQFAWWQTAFYEASSRLFLEPVFSKTSRLSQYHGVVEAARRLHDEHLSVGSYHLFRLPEEVEQDLHSLLISSVGEAIASSGPQSKEEALKQLAATNAPSSVGPKVIGSIKDLDSARTLTAMAGAYLSAFSLNTTTYPYLVR